MDHSILAYSWWPPLRHASGSDSCHASSGRATVAPFRRRIDTRKRLAARFQRVIYFLNIPYLSISARSLAASRMTLSTKLRLEPWSRPGPGPSSGSQAGRASLFASVAKTPLGRPSAASIQLSVSKDTTQARSRTPEAEQGSLNAVGASNLRSSTVAHARQWLRRETSLERSDLSTPGA